MNINDMLVENNSRAKVLRAQCDAIVKRAEAEGREFLTAAEARKSDALLAEIETLRVKRGQLKAMANEEAELDSRMAGTPVPSGAGTNTRSATIRVGHEPNTYRAPSEQNKSLPGNHQEPSFLNDLYRAQVMNDPSAHERLARHGREAEVDNPRLVERAVSTGGVSAFVPPQYMVELFAKYARAGRPMANLMQSMPLPEYGMTTNIPRLTTPTATGVQTTENTNLANQDPASTLLTSPVVTIGGYVVLSRQAVERGMLTEEVVTSDLMADYNAKLDVQLINGTGSSGQHLGLLNVSGINTATYTNATPTLGGLFPKIASAVGQVMSNRFAGPTAIVMSPTEWVWMLAQVDANGRPLIQAAEGAYNPLGASGTPGYGGQAGVLFNLPVFLDGNIPANLGAGTNETRIIVADFEDSYLFEDPSGVPSQMRFDATFAQQLSVLLVCYGYSAAAIGRQPKSISVVGGTGLITPAL